jgi:hypothetical protein
MRHHRSRGLGREAKKEEGVKGGFSKEKEVRMLWVKDQDLSARGGSFSAELSIRVEGPHMSGSESKLVPKPVGKKFVLVW